MAVYTTTDCFWARAGAAPAPRAERATARARAAARSVRRFIEASFDVWVVRAVAPRDGRRGASLRHEAAVDDHLRPRHERRLVGGEEERGAGDVPGLTDAPEGNRRLELRPELVVEVGRLQRGLDDAGVDDVRADAVP